GIVHFRKDRKAVLGIGAPVPDPIGPVVQQFDLGQGIHFIAVLGQAGIVFGVDHGLVLGIELGEFLELLIGRTNGQELADEPNISIGLSIDRGITVPLFILLDYIFHVQHIEHLQVVPVELVFKQVL